MNQGNAVIMSTKCNVTFIYTFSKRQWPLLKPCFCLNNVTFSLGWENGSELSNFCLCDAVFSDLWLSNWNVREIFFDNTRFCSWFEHTIRNLAQNIENYFCFCAGLFIWFFVNWKTFDISVNHVDTLEVIVVELNFKMIDFQTKF